MSSWKELRPSNFDGTSSPAIVVRWRILPAAEGAATQMPKVWQKRMMGDTLTTLSYRTKTRQSRRFSEFRIAWTHTELRKHYNLDTLRASCRLRMAIYQTNLKNLKALGDLELFLACDPVMPTSSTTSLIQGSLDLPCWAYGNWHVEGLITGWTTTALFGTPMRPAKAMMLAHLIWKILVLLDRD